MPDQKIVMQQILRCIDATYLPDEGVSDAEREAALRKLCNTSHVSVSIAAVCVYPQDVPKVRELLQGRKIAIATVINFPTGQEPLENVRKAIEDTCTQVDEYDVVMDYQALKDGRIDEVRASLKQYRALTQGKTLKVIIESARLTVGQIQLATQLVCECGADFVKTSTGKDPEGGATLDAVQAMLQTLLRYRNKNEQCPGIKISGGVTIDNVSDYQTRIESAMGQSWSSTNNHVRYGASELATDVVHALETFVANMFKPASGALPAKRSTPSPGY